MTSILNEHFDCIFCINLESRPDRWRVMLSRFEIAGIEVERWPAVAPVPTAARDTSALADGAQRAAVAACARSHISAVREAMRRGAHSVFLLQDDVMFHPLFEHTLREWIADLPADWDLLYLGGWHPAVAIDDDGSAFSVPRPRRVRGHVYRVYHDFCLHACGVRRSLFDAVLGIDPDAGEPIDCSFIRLFQRRRRCYGLMTAVEARPGAWGLVQQDHSLGSDLRPPESLHRFSWPGWPDMGVSVDCPLN